MFNYSVVGAVHSKGKFIRHIKCVFIQVTILETVELTIVFVVVKG